MRACLPVYRESYLRAEREGVEARPGLYSAHPAVGTQA